MKKVGRKFLEILRSVAQLLIFNWNNIGWLDVRKFERLRNFKLIINSLFDFIYLLFEFISFSVQKSVYDEINVVKILQLSRGNERTNEMGFVSAYN